MDIENRLSVSHALVVSTSILLSLSVATGDDERTPRQKEEANGAYEQGKDLFNEGMLARAIEAFTQALDSPERRCLAFANRGRAFTRMGELDRASLDVDAALSVGNKEIREKPPAAALFEQRAWVHIVMDELRRATIQRTPDFEGNRHRRTELEHAALDLARAVELEPERLKSLDLYMFVLCELRRWDSAIVTCDRALAIDATDYRRYAYRAGAHLGIKNWQKAIDDCNTILKESQGPSAAPPRIDVLTLRASAFVGAEQWDRALADLNIVTQMEPEDPALYVTRAFVRSMKDDLEHAVLDLEKAIDCDPTIARNVRTLRVYFCCISAETVDDALSVLDRLCDSHPKQAECFLMRAWARVAAGDMTGASGDHDYAAQFPMSPHSRELADMIMQKLKARGPGRPAGHGGQLRTSDRLEVGKTDYPHESQ